MRTHICYRKIGGITFLTIGPWKFQFCESTKVAPPAPNQIARMAIDAAAYGLVVGTLFGVLAHG